MGLEQQETMAHFLSPSRTQRGEKYLWLKVQHTITSAFEQGCKGGGGQKELDWDIQQNAAQWVFVGAVRFQSNTEHTLAHWKWQVVTGINARGAKSKLEVSLRGTKTQVP